MKLCYDHDEFGNLYLWYELEFDELNEDYFKYGDIKGRTYITTRHE